MPKLPRSTSSATSSMASETIPSRPAKPHPDRLKIMHLFPDRPLGVAMASNVGSKATITGNPQNMIIGSVSHIPYGAFAAALAPVAGAGLVLTVALIALFHRREF